MRVKPVVILEELSMERNIDEVIIRITDSGVLIIGAWTVAISIENAMQYIHNYGKSPDIGFFEDFENVILSHNSGKILFTKKEATKIIDQIKKAYK